MNGKGTLIKADGNKYEGSFVNGFMNGTFLVYKEEDLD